MDSAARPLLSPHGSCMAFPLAGLGLLGMKKPLAGLLAQTSVAA